MILFVGVVKVDDSKIVVADVRTEAYGVIRISNIIHYKYLYNVVYAINAQTIGANLYNM